MISLTGWKRVADLRVPKELVNKNAGQTSHWSSSHKHREGFRNAVLRGTAEPAETGEPEPLDKWLQDFQAKGKVGIVVRRLMGPRQSQWDPDSVLRGNAKQLIDTLVEYGLVEDDGPKHVAWVIGTQDDGRHEKASTIVEVWVNGE